MEAVGGEKPGQAEEGTRKKGMGDIKQREKEPPSPQMVGS